MAHAIILFMYWVVGADPRHSNHLGNSNLIAG